MYDPETVRVYQAYGDAIADTALAAGSFVSPPFSLSRMTWVKPSFLWMMYRSGWALKDEGQKRILAVDISRAGFEWAMANSCVSDAYTSASPEKRKEAFSRHPVRIQWDPERDLESRALPYRSLQMGLSGIAMEQYVTQWIRRITDVTSLAREIHAAVQSGAVRHALSLLPQERSYPISDTLAAIIGASR